MDNAVRANCALTVERIRASHIIAAAPGAGHLKPVGGRGDRDGGEVEIVGT